MPHIRSLSALAAVLLLTACSSGPGGVTYDPNRGLVLEKSQGNDVTEMPRQIASRLPA